MRARKLSLDEMEAKAMLYQDDWYDEDKRKLDADILYIV
jgi:hypothetical protein